MRLSTVSVIGKGKGLHYQILMGSLLMELLSFLLLSKLGAKYILWTFHYVL